MKILTQKDLKGRSKQELRHLLLLLETDKVITPDHERNMDEIKIALNGGRKHTDKEVLEDIEAGAADISDIGGMN